MGVRNDFRRLQILSKRRPPPPEGGIFRSGRGFGPRSPPPVSAPAFLELNTSSTLSMVDFIAQKSISVRGALFHHHENTNHSLKITSYVFFLLHLEQDNLE